MDWSERQEYYDLIEEEIRFQPDKGQKWLFTFEERHTFGSDIVFHVYSQKGIFFLQVYEVVDVMELEVEERLHKISDAVSGNLRIRLSTLKRELPGDLKHETHERDGSSFKLTLLADEVKSFAWEFPLEGFERIQPVLKLIWAVDGWKQGAKVMGWATVRGGSRELGAGSGQEKKVDPFGKTVRGGGGRGGDTLAKRSGRGRESQTGSRGRGLREQGRDRWSPGGSGKAEPEPRKKGSSKGKKDPFGKSWDWKGD